MATKVVLFFVSLANSREHLARSSWRENSRMTATVSVHSVPTIVPLSVEQPRQRRWQRKANGVGFVDSDGDFEMVELMRASRAERVYDHATNSGKVKNNVTQSTSARAQAIADTPAPTSVSLNSSAPITIKINPAVKKEDDSRDEIIKAILNPSDNGANKSEVTTTSAISYKQGISPETTTIAPYEAKDANVFWWIFLSLGIVVLVTILNLMIVMALRGVPGSSNAGEIPQEHDLAEKKSDRVRDEQSFSNSASSQMPPGRRAA